MRHKLLVIGVNSGESWSCCGRTVKDVTDDPALVECRRCLKALESKVKSGQEQMPPSQPPPYTFKVSWLGGGSREFTIGQTEWTEIKRLFKWTFRQGDDVRAEELQLTLTQEPQSLLEALQFAAKLISDEAKENADQRKKDVTERSSLKPKGGRNPSFGKWPTES